MASHCAGDAACGAGPACRSAALFYISRARAYCSQKPPRAGADACNSPLISRSTARARACAYLCFN